MGTGYSSPVRAVGEKSVRPEPVLGTHAVATLGLTCGRRASTTVAQLRPLAPQTPAPGERGRAGEEQPGHRRLVAGQLGLACCAGRPAGRRRSWRRGPRGGGTRARRRRASRPASRRSTPASPVRSASANSSSHRRGSDDPAQPPGRAYGVSRTSRLRTWRPGGAIVGSAIVGTLASRAGCSMTSPVASSAAARSISATVGATVSVGDSERPSRSTGSRSSTASSFDS